MADTESKPTQPVVTRLDAVGVSASSQTGKATIETFTVSGMSTTTINSGAFIHGVPSIHSNPVPVKKNKKLKSLAEWNSVNQFSGSITTPQPNGIGCPQCGAELCDTRPSESFSNFSGTFKHVGCTCGFKGERRA